MWDRLGGLWPWFYLVTVAPAAWMDWRRREAPTVICLLWGGGTLLLTFWASRLAGDPGPWLRLGLGLGGLGWLWRRGHLGAADLLLGLPLLVLQPLTWVGAGLLSLFWLRRRHRQQVPVVSLLWGALLATTVAQLWAPQLLSPLYPLMPVVEVM